MQGTPPPIRERVGIPPPAEIHARARYLCLHPVLVRSMFARGFIDAGEQSLFCEPMLGQLRPPDAMAGFLPALELLEHAWRKRWRVGVFGDYDVDGITTATLLTTYLEALGLEVVARVADRGRGYGFT